DRTQLPVDVLEPRRPGDPDHRGERKPRADQNEQRVLGRVSLEMRGRPEESPEAHTSRIGLRRGSLNPTVVVTVSPDTPHGETGTTHNPDEPELFVAVPTVPEVEAERDDDQHRRPVEHDDLPGRPRRDLVPPVAPEQVDEE